MYNVPMVNPGFRHVQYGLCSRKKKVAVNRLKKKKQSNNGKNSRFVKIDGDEIGSLSEG
jgi:hypothetical protein